MSLVSNFIGGIGANSLSNLSNPLKTDVSKDFEAYLLKQLEEAGKNGVDNTSPLFNLGAPAGFEIENFDGMEVKEAGQVEACDEKIDTQENMSSPFDMNGDGEVTTSETVTFFTSLLNKGTQGEKNHSELLDFAKKQASNFYNKYSKSVVLNVEEFVDDIHGMIN